jgi:hypothetical protein
MVPATGQPFINGSAECGVMSTPAPPNWLLAVRCYLAASFAGHIVWEVAQMPLYTLWRTGSRAEIAWSILHCTMGDVLIASTALMGDAGRPWFACLAVQARLACGRGDYCDWSRLYCLQRAREPGTWGLGIRGPDADAALPWHRPGSFSAVADDSSPLSCLGIPRLPALASRGH